jgi:hypothetical protein
MADEREIAPPIGLSRRARFVNDLSRVARTQFQIVKAAPLVNRDR